MSPLKRKWKETKQNSFWLFCPLHPQLPHFVPTVVNVLSCRWSQILLPSEDAVTNVLVIVKYFLLLTLCLD